MPVILGGNTGIYLASLAPSVDPDAQAFITAASITDPTQQSAINQLVVDLKGYNIWTKMKGIWPFVGGTATTHKWNLKNPLDTDAAFRILWSGGVTHSSNGVQFGGVNGYGDTKFIPSSALTLNSSHISFYSRTTSTGDSGIDDFGTYIGLNQAMRMMIKIQNTTDSIVDMNSVSQRITGTVTTPSGLFLANRQNSTSLKYTRNTTSLGTNTNANTGTLPTTVMGLGCLYNNSTASFTNFSARQCAFASVGDGLTDTEAANFYTAVQAFQVSLGRSIGTQTVSDADAQAFVTNAGIVDQVEANAVNNLVIGLKADGLWTKMKAVYPFVGGTSTTHKYNLKNPLDTDAAFRLAFNGGATHSSTGYKPNGTNGYAGTFIYMSTELSATNLHTAYYSRTNVADNLQYDCGVTDNTTKGWLIMRARTAAGNATLENGSASFNGAVANSQGLYIGTSTASNSHKIYKNDSTVASSTTAQTQTLFTNPQYFGAAIITTGGAYYSTRELAFASVGTGLNDTDATNLNNRVTTFQTALNRNV